MSTSIQLGPVALAYLREDRAEYAYQILLADTEVERDLAYLAAGYVVLTGGKGHPERAYVVSSISDLRWTRTESGKANVATQVKTPSGEWVRIVAAERADRINELATLYADRPTAHTGY